MSRILRTLTLAACTAVLPAQDSKTPKTAPSPAPAPREPEYVTSRDFKSRMFFVQHRSPRALAEVLRPLMSGFKGATLEYTERDGLRTLSARDFPENLAALEEAIKRLDVPAVSRTAAELEFHIHVLLAHRKDGPSEGFPEELKDVLASLKSTLAYRSFTPVASFVHRASADARNMHGKGSADLPGDKVPSRLDMDWMINRVEVVAGTSGPAVLNLHEFQLRSVLRPADVSTNISTDLSLKAGEKVVVGTSALKDQGLIVVLTAKILK